MRGRCLSGTVAVVAAAAHAVTPRPLTIWLPAIRAGSGADVFVLRLAAGLERAGHRPHVQWFDHRWELTPWRLRGIAPPAGIDLIHAASWQAFAFRRPGLPLVVTEHQYVAHPAFTPWRSPAQALYHRWLVQRWTARSYACADALVAVSEHVATVMREDLQRPVLVIHNWIDGEKFAPVARSGPPRDESAPFRLLFVGNPSRWKGADLLPELAERLGPRFEIHCLGGLRKGYATRALPPNMKRLERVAPDAMPALYAQFDAALVPTRYEAFGYVALEAMACALPVIGFASTGTAEVAIDGDTALLAPQDDVAQLANLARRLAADAALCERLGNAGRARALTCFDEPRAIMAWLALYRHVLTVGAH